jgi:hypothetical protein
MNAPATVANKYKSIAGIDTLHGQLATEKCGCKKLVARRNGAAIFIR